jgi:hypothetical protein
MKEMKRDLSNPLAPTFGEKPKRKTKTVTPIKSGGTVTEVTKNKKDKYGKSKVKKTVVRDASGKVVSKFKSKTPKGNIYNSKKRTVTSKGKVIKEDKMYGYEPEGERKRVKAGSIAKTKSTYVTPSGTKVKKKRKLTKDFQTKTTTVIKKPGEKRVKTVSYKKV